VPSVHKGLIRALAQVIRTPALTALLIQVSSAVILLFLLRVFVQFAHPKIDLLVAALLQGLIAACATRLLGLASWWVLIQLLFPSAILLTLSFHIPPVVFLSAFLFFVALYWSCFRTQVPYYPSSRFAEQTVLALLPQRPGLRVIDIGSGLGGLVINLTILRPDSEFIGIEIAPLPWLFSYCRGQFGRVHARFIRGDYQGLDFACFDVVFAYLSPAAMSALWQKASAEMRSGCLLLSYEFTVAEKSPDVTIFDPNGGPALYGWRF
jgi:SAM-dependent methyltransferase